MPAASSPTSSASASHSDAAYASALAPAKQAAGRAAGALAIRTTSLRRACVVVGLAVALSAAVGAPLLLVTVLGAAILLATVSAGLGIFLFVPAVLHVVLSTPSSRLLPPLRLFHPIQNYRLLVTCYCTLLDLHRSGIVNLLLDEWARKIVLLGGGTAAEGGTGMREVVRGDIVYIPASATRPARLLDVYLPRSSRFDSDDEESEKENLPPTPVIVVLAFPSYRLAGSRSFPASAIARQLSTHLNARVVVPALTPFGDGHDRALERMVGETRACLAWVRRNILRYGGSPEKVYLMGYGAGAHIAALTVVQSAVAASRDEYHAHRAEYLSNLEGHGGLNSTANGVSRDLRHSEWSADELSIDRSGLDGWETGAGAASIPEQKSPAEEAALTASGRLRERTTSSGYAPSHVRFGASEGRSRVNGEVDDHVEQLLHECRTRRSAHPLDTGPFGAQNGRAGVNTGCTHTITSPDLGHPVAGRCLRDLDAARVGALRREAMPHDRCRSAQGGADSVSHARRAPNGDGAPQPPEQSVEGFQAAAAADPAAPRGSNSPVNLEVPDSFGALTKLGVLGSPPTGSTPADEDYVPVKGLILVEGTYDVAKQAAWEYECGTDQVSCLKRLCGGSSGEILHACPSHLLYAASPLLLLPARFPVSSNDQPLSRRFLPRKVLVLHGGADHLSPFSPAVLFHNLLLGVGSRSDEAKVKIYRQLTGFGAMSALTGAGDHASLLYHELAEMLEREEGDPVRPDREVRVSFADP
ncbi:hypothetical protein JCM8202v2_005763 [Rhodotorula sphaerocarpa]